jgi:hypothetical protein
MEKYTEISQGIWKDVGINKWVINLINEIYAMKKMKPYY